MNAFSKMVLTLWLCFAIGCDDADPKLISNQAYTLTEKIVALGPRAPGSTGIEKVRMLLRSEVSQKGLVMQEHIFEANSPLGPIEMKNLYVDVPGKTKKQILLGAHYDSKLMRKLRFLGANDAASSVALLLALIDWIKDQNFDHSVRIVLFDGEEALVSWSSRDSLYGSKAYVRYSQHLKDVKAVVILDMISDHKLELIRSKGAHPKLMGYLEEVMTKLKLSGDLAKTISSVADDHQPFVQKGLPTLHLMDFTFGGDQSPGLYWHTEQDTMAQVSQESLLKMTLIMMGLLPKIDQATF